MMVFMLTNTETEADFNCHVSRVDMVKVDFGRHGTRRLVRVLQALKLIKKT